MQSVDRVAAVLMAFTSGPSELGVTDIAQRLDLPKSAVHRILESLTESGLTSKERERGKYRLGPRATELSLAVLGTVDVRSLALPVMEELRDKTGETVTLTFAIALQRIYVAQVESRQDVRMTVEVGRRAPLYAGASGRAILMTFSMEDLDKFLNQVELKPLTDNTVQDRAELKRLLAEDAARGHTVSLGERDPYAAAVAAPLMTKGARAFGSISVCGPLVRLNEESLERHGDAVARAAAKISHILGGH